MRCIHPESLLIHDILATLISISTVSEGILLYLCFSLLIRIHKIAQQLEYLDQYFGIRDESEDIIDQQRHKSFGNCAWFLQRCKKMKDIKERVTCRVGLLLRSSWRFPSIDSVNSPFFIDSRKWSSCFGSTTAPPPTKITVNKHSIIYNYLWNIHVFYRGIVSTYQTSLQVSWTLHSLLLPFKL